MEELREDIESWSGIDMHNVPDQDLEKEIHRLTDLLCDEIRVKGYRLRKRLTSLNLNSKRE